MATLNEMSIQLNHAGILAVLCLFVLVCVFLCGLSIILYFHGYGRMKEIRRELNALAQQLHSLESVKEADDRNKNSLNSESLKSRFEQIAETKTIPDKYRHIAQLERSGIGAEEIAEILDVSKYEAEQMLTLARLSKGESRQSGGIELKTE